MPYLPKMSKLSSLNIAWNFLHKLEGFEKTDKFSRAMQRLSEIPNLTDLNLEGIRIASWSNENRMPLIQSFSRMKSLTKLNLGYNHLGTLKRGDALVLVKTLAKMSRLKTLDI
jgi:hypothetical protein